MPFISEIETIYLQRFYTGWITLRNQLATPIKLMGRRVIELYDALIAGNDWEVTPALSLKRRAGHTAYVTLNFPALNMVSWKSNTQGTIPVIDTTGDIEYVNSGGTVTAITTKTNPAQCGMLGIGNYFYMGDTSSNLKWDGPNGLQGVTNWGIAYMSSAPQEAATAGQNISIHNWTNPGNLASNVSYATYTPAGISQGVAEAYNFGFSVSTIASTATVTFNAFTTGAQGSATNLNVYLIYNQFPVGSAVLIRISPTLTSYSVTLPMGAFTVSQINNSTANGFGIGFQFPTSASPFGLGSGTGSVNNVQVTLALSGVGTPTPTGSGSFSAVNGYTYVVAYGNSVSGEISNASPATTNTGPFTNKAYVALAVTASTDPQVNQIRVYRTTDSGGGNQYFEISNSPFPNTTATIQDTTPDTSLQVTSQPEVNLGNTPPPTGLINLEWFAGRMWGSVGNLLYASTGPETIAGTAPNSNWNPLFQYVIPGVIVRNVAGPNGMLVFTQDDCFIVRGTDITNYTINEFIKDFGARTYNAVDTDGTNLYVFTSDRQFIQVSSSGANDLGLPIADQLGKIDPISVYVKVNRYGLDSIVRILDTINNLYVDYNLNQQCWNLPGILQMPACSAMGSTEVSPGVWRLLLCSTSSGTSQLAYRDITNFQDLGANYAPNAVFGSIQLADPGTLAKFGAAAGFTMQYTSVGTIPILKILLNDIGCTLTNAIGSQITGSFQSLSVGKNPFQTPPTLGNQATGFRNLSYYLASIQSRQSGFVQHLQFELSAPAENKATELIGFAIFGDQKQETPQAGQIPQLQGR